MAHVFIDFLELLDSLFKCVDSCVLAIAVCSLSQTDLRAATLVEMSERDTERIQLMADRRITAGHTHISSRFVLGVKARPTS